MEKQPKKIIDYDNCESIDEINNLLCMNSDSQLNLTNKDITDEIYNTTKWNASLYNFTGDITLVAPNNKDGIFHVHCSVYTNNGEFVGNFLLKSPLLYKNDSEIVSSEIFPYEGSIGVNQITVNRNFDSYGEDRYYDEITVDSALYSQELFNYDINELNIEESYGATIYVKSYTALEFDIIPGNEYELYVDGELRMTAIADGGIYNDNEYCKIIFIPEDWTYEIEASFVMYSYYGEGEVKLKITDYDDGNPFTFSNITIKTKEGMIKTPLYTDIHNVYFQPIHLNTTHLYYDETKDVNVSDSPQ